MHDEIAFEDRLSSRLSLAPADRAWLRRTPPTVLAGYARKLMALLGLDEDAVWRMETGRTEAGWLPVEYDRFVVWKAHGGNIATATEDWTHLTRSAFLRHLIAGGQVGLGDEVVSRG